MLHHDAGFWPDLVEVRFGIIEGQATHQDLNAKIRAFIDGWDDCADTFVWPRTTKDL